MKIGIVINENAGSIKDADYSAGGFIKIFKLLDVEAEILEAPGDKLNEAAVILIHKGIDAIVAAGGDGTVSAVASAAAGNKIPFGIIPLGTLNHFAKDLNIPLTVEEAASVIAENHVIRVDIGEVNENIFINNSSIGFYPKLVKHRDEEKERISIFPSTSKAGKWVAMFKAFINLFIRFPVMKVRIISDINHIHCTTPFVFIGNNEYEMDLFNLGTRTKITGGTLSLYYPLVGGRLSMLKFFLLALINKLDQHTNFNIETITALTIETRRNIIDVSLDGEVFHLRSPLNYKIRPMDLTVIVPEVK